MVTRAPRELPARADGLVLEASWSLWAPREFPALADGLVLDAS